jgi:transketolase
MIKKNEEELFNLAIRAKKLILDLHFHKKSGHVGSALSCLEILACTRFCWMGDDNSLVLSKGHAASALYSILAVAGDISEEELRSNYYRDGTLFSAHPPPNRLPKISFATGSLGHGPGIAAGISLGYRFLDSRRRVYCVVSDGEMNEGSVWEAVAFSRQFRLSNLCLIVDRNGLQGFGRTKDVMDLSPLEEKFAAFGFAFRVVNGHNLPELLEQHDLLVEDCTRQNVPGVIIADTIKGYGLPSLQDTLDCHYLPMSDSEYLGAIAKLNSNRIEVVKGRSEQSM